MKTCSTCKVAKEAEAFARNRAKSDGLQAECRECKKKRDAAYYAADPESQLSRNRRYRNSVLLKVAQYLQEHPCVDCGESEWILLQFDHVRGTKCGDISQLSRGWSWKKLQTEIEKCEVRCAHCHIRKTAESLGHYKWFSDNMGL